MTTRQRWNDAIADRVEHQDVCWLEDGGCSPADDRGPSGAIWEPYQFSVGDRVRCVPSPECRNPRLDEPGLVGHDLDEFGQVGTVEAVDISPGRQHRYEVGWDTDTFYRGYWWDGGDYAALELEPLAAAQAPGADEEAQS